MKPTGTSENSRQLEWWAKEAVVYFIGAGSPTSAIKIGVTTWSTVAKRLAAIQSSNHEFLQLLGILPFRDQPLPMKAAEDQERKLHELFRHLQCAPEGQRGYEWFRAKADLLAYIDRHTVKPETLGFARSARPAVEANRNEVI